MEVHAASPELSKELLDLSGWDSSGLLKHHTPEADSAAKYGYRVFIAANGRRTSLDEAHSYENGIWLAPMYTLGYLLRKLPAKILDDKTYYLSIEKTDQDDYIACYGVTTSRGHREAPSVGNFITIDPEDALAKIAIQLFKAGILKREDRDV